ncbi:uncharacterized protein [Onthophagus taurus]|uniref:uncharacterized protein n=1 Tax=Onthophagus taurus TaxID=166361 RepID=UPI0039BE2194
MYILAVIDGFTKYLRLYPCRKTDSKEVIKHLQTYFDTYSKPQRIVSDRGSCFTSNEFKKIVNEYEINRHRDASEDPKKWDRALLKVEFAMNNTVNRSTKETPNMLLNGVQQRGKINDNLRLMLAGKMKASEI